MWTYWKKIVTFDFQKGHNLVVYVLSCEKRMHDQKHQTTKDQSFEMGLKLSSEVKNFTRGGNFQFRADFLSQFYH